MSNSVDQDVVEQFSYMNVYELSQFRILFHELISIFKTLSRSCVTVIFFLNVLCVYTTWFLKELINILGLFTVTLKESNSTFQ